MILVLAAILIPIIVVSVHRQKQSDKSGCAKTNPCNNDGVSVSSGSECSCVCTGGFTGIQCDIPGDASCSTTQISSSSQYGNVTVGNSLPGVFQSSVSQFGISLDQITIMALFSQMNATCYMENQLVALAVGNRRRRRRREDDDDDVNNETMPKKLLSRSHHAHQNSRHHSYTFEKRISNNNNNNNNNNKNNNISDQALAFARIAILFVFEKTGFFAAAQDAEQRIYSYFTTTTSSSAVLDLPRYDIAGNNQFVLDFDRFSITMPDGEVDGGGK